MDYTVTFFMRGYFTGGRCHWKRVMCGIALVVPRGGEPQFAMAAPESFPLQGYNLASRGPLGRNPVVHAFV